MINWIAIRLVVSALMMAFGMLMFFMGLSAGETHVFWDTVFLSTLMVVVGAGIMPTRL